MSLLERAERAYETLTDEDYGKNRRSTIPNAGEFDFLMSPETTMPIPIHKVEIRREERRRRGNADRETSKQEFAAALGIDVEDTRDPDSGHSVLEVTEAVRAYFGDPEDEAYRNFRHQMSRITDDITFLKENTFVGASIASHYEQVRRFNEYMEQQEARDADQAHAGGIGAAAGGQSRAEAARRLLEGQYTRAHQESLRQFRERQSASKERATGA